MPRFREVVMVATESEDEQPVDRSYVFLMRHEEHDEGTLVEESHDRIRGVAGRFGGWLAANPGPVEVAYLGGPEVVETMRLLVTGAAGAVASGDAGLAAGPFPFRPADESAGTGSAADGGPVAPGGWIDGLPTTAVRGPWRPPFEPLDRRDGQAVAAVVARDEIDLGPYDPDPTRMRHIRDWLCGTDQDGRHATRRLLVGNDPMLSWLATDLAGDCALARGELACLERRRRTVADRHRLVWTVAPQDDEELAPIQAKIRSKMATAGSIGTVVTGLLVFLLKDGLDVTSAWSWATLMALGGASVLYFVALFHLDSLSMPPRFWGAGPSPPGRDGRWFERVRRRLLLGRSGLSRPPSSSARVLTDAMVHTWTSLFLGATVLGGLGIAALVGRSVAEALGHGRDQVVPERAVAVAAFWFLLLAVYAAAQRPNLGASD